MTYSLFMIGKVVCVRVCVCAGGGGGGVMKLIKIVMAVNMQPKCV